MDVKLFSDPVMQLGFAGVCIIQFAIGFWFVNKIFGMLKELIEKLLKVISENTESNRDLRNVLSIRPCLKDDSEFK